MVNFMKTLIALCLCLLSLSTAFAQRDIVDNGVDYVSWGNNEGDGNLVVPFDYDGTLYWNGGWATNEIHALGGVEIGGTNVVALMQSTAASAVSSALADVGAITYAPSNFVSGHFYTNTSGFVERVSVCTTNTSSAVIGSCQAELWVGPSTNSATMYPADNTGSATLLTVLGTTAFGHLAGDVPPGGYFVFTNLSTGAGNSVVLRNNSGQLTVEQ